MEQEQLLKNLKEKFEQYKNDIQLKLSFDQIEKMIFLQDLILDRKYVPVDLGVAIRGRSMDLFNSWYGYIHGIILPNPQSIPMHMEAQFFDDKEKEKLNKLMSKIMYFLKKSSYIGLTKNKQEEARFIEETYTFWEETLKGQLTTMIHLSSQKFLEESNKEIKPQKKSMY